MKSLRLIVAGLLLLIGISAAFLSCFKPKPLGPMEIAIWYWHSPFEIPPDQASELKRMGIGKLFVRCGTFTTDGSNVVLKIPQEFKGQAKLDLHLVFNFDSGVIRHFETFNLETMADQVASRIQKQVERVRKQGQTVKGFQLDFDVPTRLISRYVDLIRKIKPKLANQNLQISSTGLMSWLGTKGVRELSEELDFMVPQAYEGITGKTVQKMRPVFDPEYLKQSFRKASLLRCPYYIGIPAYGHGFLFDTNDALVSTYQKLSPVEVFRHPSFKFLNAIPVDRYGQTATEATAVGEEIIKFKAIRPAPDGRGLGYTLAYSIPTAQQLVKALNAVKSMRKFGCLGAVIYRYPEDESVLTLSFQEFSDVLLGKQTRPDLKVKVWANKQSFEVIDGATQGPIPTDVFLEIENTGNAPTFIAPDAVQLKLTFTETGFGEIRLRDMDSIQTGQVMKDDSFQTTNPKNARTLKISKAYLASHQKALLGPIRLLSGTAKSVDVQWTMRDSDGFKRWQKDLKSIPLWTK